MEEIKRIVNILFQLRCSISGRESWEALFSSPVCSVANGTQFVVAACQDGSLHVFNSMKGDKRLPPIVLDSGIARMTVKDAK